jgi:hypothetical protein
MKLFLDDTKPLHTCRESSCQNCDISGQINCHFQLKQLLRFLSFGFLLFILGGIGIFRFSGLVLFIWLLLIISYFGFIEIRVMCSHCPHYAETELNNLKCWANYGSPKLWKYRPGPMSQSEKIIFFLGLMLIFSSPVLFMILSKEFILLIIYTALIILATYLLKAFYCAKCMNFACPLNSIDSEVRAKFFYHNDILLNAWQKNNNN